MKFNRLLSDIFRDVSLYLNNETEECYLQTYNISGDYVKNIDIKCEKIFIKHLSENKVNIIGYISEETENITFLKNIDIDENIDNYIIAFDPLDGSSNFKTNNSTGSIYAIYKYCKKNNKLINIHEAGYCLYGIKSIMVYTENDKVFIKNIFDNSIPKQLRFGNNKNKSKIYSINQSNSYQPEIRFLVNYYKSNNYNTRWAGALVSDAHRILLEDGIFFYPTSEKYPKGKIRLLYESLPFAFIFKKAEGIGINENFKDILSRIPNIDLDNPHITDSIILTSSQEYKLLKELMFSYEEYKF